ncbi:MAG: protein-methionine-sulfoxide reductase heme-binding subunit MsrQ [Candidatus Korobacteraceae bacterium]
MKPRYLKPIIFLACLLPLARLGWKALNAGLGANPIQVITWSTGTWTLVFLLVTLSITPLRKLTRQYWLIQYRRMIGLFAFFYACLHFTTYIWLDQFFDLHSVYKDIYKRPFITVGFTAFVLMIPLAVTSTKWAIRKLGKRWQMLHRLIYFTAIAGVIHFLWAVKLDKRVPEIYGAILGALLLDRLIVWYGRRTTAPKPAASRGQAPARPVIIEER